MSFRPRLDNNNQSWQTLIDLAREVSPEKLLEIYDANIVEEVDSPKLTITGDKAKDIDQLLKKYRLDKDLWNVDKARVNDWMTHFRVGDNIESRVNYQIRVEVSRRVVNLKPIDQIINEYLDKLAVDFPKKDYEHEKSDQSPIVVVLADAHIGAYHNNKITEAHSTESIIRKLAEISQIVNEYDAPVHILFLGDLIESFTGLNKQDSWQYVVMHGAEVALTAYDILTEFIGSLTRFEKMYMISGNHDRITSDAKDDASGQVMQLIYGMITRLSPSLEVEYDPYILNPTIDGVRYIMTHGNHKITKMKPEEMVFLYGDQHKFNVLISAHLHNRTVGNDTYKFRTYVSPSLCSGSIFSERNGWYANSGFLIFRAKGNSVNCFDYNLEP